jgi:MFS family permease
MLAILVGAYLHALGSGPFAVGAIGAAGLAGCTLAALLATLRADRWGRRRVLGTTGLLASGASLALAVASAPWLLLVAAFLGMFNAMGKDRGAALLIEQAALPGTVADERRTGAFARYHVAQDAGHAAGAGAAALPTLLQSLGLAEVPALQWGIAAAAVLLGASGAVYAVVSRAVEAAPAAAARPLSPSTRRVVGRISALFLIDAVGGGFLTTSWLSVFFLERFGVAVGTVAALFASARVLNAASHLAAAWLAARIGLVNTMVFAHIPSSLLLLTVALTPSFPVAATLFLLREGLVEMDVPTRQSYLMAVVAPHERTRASGITSLVRLGGWTVGQAAAGVAGPAALGLSLAIGAGLKISYDVLLFAMFRSRKPPEET